jgi:hypothetical protein
VDANAINLHENGRNEKQSSDALPLVNAVIWLIGDTKPSLPSQT